MRPLTMSGLKMTAGLIVFVILTAGCYGEFSCESESIEVLQVCELGSYTGSNVLLDFSTAGNGYGPSCWCNVVLQDYGNLVMESHGQPGYDKCGTSIKFSDQKKQSEIGCSGGTETGSYLPPDSVMSVQLQKLTQPYDTEYCLNIYHNNQAVGQFTVTCCNEDEENCVTTTPRPPPTTTVKVTASLPVQVCEKGDIPVLQICELGSYTGSNVLLDFSTAGNGYGPSCWCNVVLQDYGNLIMESHGQPGYDKCGTSIKFSDQKKQSEIGCSGGTETSSYLPPESVMSVQLQKLTQPYDTEYCLNIYHSNQMSDGKFTITCCQEGEENCGPTAATKTTTTTTTPITQPPFQCASGNLPVAKMCESNSYTGSQVVLDFSSIAASNFNTCSCYIQQLSRGDINFYAMDRPGYFFCGSAIYVWKSDKTNLQFEVGCQGGYFTTDYLQIGNKLIIQLQLRQSPYDAGFCYKLEHGSGSSEDTFRLTCCADGQEGCWRTTTTVMTPQSTTIIQTTEPQKTKTTVPSTVTDSQSLTTAEFTTTAVPTTVPVSQTTTTTVPTVTEPQTTTTTDPTTVTETHTSTTTVPATVTTPQTTTTAVPATVTEPQTTTTAVPTTVTEPQTTTTTVPATVTEPHTSTTIVPATMTEPQTTTTSVPTTVTEPQTTTTAEPTKDTAIPTTVTKTQTTTIAEVTTTLALLTTVKEPQTTTNIEQTTETELPTRKTTISQPEAEIKSDFPVEIAAPVLGVALLIVAICAVAQCRRKCNKQKKGSRPSSNYSMYLAAYHDVSIEVNEDKDITSELNMSISRKSVGSEDATPIFPSHFAAENTGDMYAKVRKNNSKPQKTDKKSTNKTSEEVRGEEFYGINLSDLQLYDNLDADVLF